MITVPIPTLPDLPFLLSAQLRTSAKEVIRRTSLKVLNYLHHFSQVNIPTYVLIYWMKLKKVSILIFQAAFKVIHCFRCGVIDELAIIHFGQRYSPE